MFSTGTQHAPESLQAALLGLARNQLVALLVLWLIFYAPVTCQYHGLLLNAANESETQRLPPHLHEAERYTDASNTTDIATTKPSQALKRMHSTTAASMFLTSLLTVLSPESVGNSKLDVEFVLHLAEAPLPLQPEQPPPEQPPRLIRRAILDLFNGNHLFHSYLS